MKSKQDKGVRLFQRTSLVTLIAIYLLIFVGGVVRTTGSGMGCPDWPKCFGQWVPPTSEPQLPEDYKDIYSQKRAKKNKRFAKYLTALGFEGTAERILNDKSILEEEDFNAVKTWIEYVNRLLGALIGILIFATLVIAFRFRKTRSDLFYISLAAFVAVIFQGWIGSIVVSTNLLPWMITFHMFLALLIVGLLIYVVNEVNDKSEGLLIGGLNRVFRGVLIMLMIVSAIQIAMGTQVREMIDVISNDVADRSVWIENLGVDFLIHRSFSWIILIFHLFLGYVLYKSQIKSVLFYVIFGVMIMSIVTGVVMAYLNVPAIAQPVHLLMGTLGIGLQFLLFLQLNNNRISRVHL